MNNLPAPRIHATSSHVRFPALLRKILSAFLAAFTVTGAADFLSAQTKPKADDQQPVRPTKPLEYDVSVVLKLVQVSVLDSKEKPVADLAQSDFVVYDNGRPMTISAFEKHTLAAAPAARPAEARLAATPLSPNSLMARKFFLFLDFAYNSQRGVAKAKEAALHFMDANVLPGDQIGIISYSLLKGLRIHEYLTVDHAKARETIEALNVKEIAGRAEDVEAEYWRRATEGGASGDGANYEANDLFRLEGNRNDSKKTAQVFILKLTDLARAIRYVPGRKNLVLFSTGIANSILYGNQAGESGTGSRAKLDTGDFLIRTQNEEMLKELSSSNCTFFIFDTRDSAKVPSLFDYDAQTFESRNRDLFSSGGVRTSTTNIYRDESVTGQYGLVRMSTTTGGKYFSNIEEYKRNLDQMQNLTGTYYVLGFSVGEKWDGRYHEIKVEVRRKGCDVRAQSGYYNPKPFAEFSDLEKRLHLYDLALSENPLFQNPLPAATLALAGHVGAGSGPNLVLLTSLPPGSPEKLSGSKVEIVTFIFDPREDIVDLRRSEDSLAKYKGRSVYYASGAKLPPGSYKCRIVVRDLETGQAAIATTRVVIPGAPAAGIRLETPLLLTQAGREVYLEGRDSAAGNAAAADSIAALNWAALYPFDAKMQAPLLGDFPAGVESVDVILPCSIYGIAGARVALKISLSEEGRTAAIPVRIAHKGQVVKGNAVINIFEIPTAGLAAGNYTLEFKAEEPTTKAVSDMKTRFVVK